MKLGIGIIVILFVIAGLWMYSTHEPNERAYKSKYYYHVYVSTSVTLDKVTLYLPMPMFDGESKIANEIIAGNAQKPDDWSVDTVETEHGKMLKISAEKITPKFNEPPSFVTIIEPGKAPREVNYSDMPIPNDLNLIISKELYMQVEADHEINTQNSIGNESLLSPKYNTTPSVCDVSSLGGESINCYNYESRIYADYVTSSPDAKVNIRVVVTGTNTKEESGIVESWFGHDHGLMDEYDDQVEITLSGEQHGWHIASGELVEGVSHYYG